LQHSGRTHAQVGVFGYPGGAAQPPDLAIRTHAKVDVVAEVHELKTGLQLVVAVRPAADDM
jgi:hypothetical protein